MEYPKEVIGTAFLYECLGGEQLDVPIRLGVNDNLPGTAYFCPLVVMKTALVDAMSLGVPSLLEQLRQEFGDELLQKSAVWLTLGESRSSFAIEGEGE